MWNPAAKVAADAIAVDNEHVTRGGKFFSTGCAAATLLASLALPGCRPPPPRRPLQDVDPIFVIPAIADAADQSRPADTTVAQLIDRLDDRDAAVRWAAHEALKQISGRDFGYEPWLRESGESDATRSAAISRWREWARTNGKASPEQLLR